MIPVDLQNVIRERAGNMPDYLQESLSAFDWIAMLEEIGIKHRLCEQQKNSFVAETAQVILGVEDPTMLQVNLKNHCGVSDMIARLLVSEVSERIFSRLQRELEQTVGQTPEILRERIKELDEMEALLNTPAREPIVTNSKVQDQSQPIKRAATPQFPGHDPYKEEID